MLADPAPDAALTYSVNVAFRSNIGSDPGANQIAEAVLQFGQQTLSSFAASKTMVWTDGQPVQMTLRWATNAPTIPAGGSDAAQDVQGPEVVLRYGGTWALLRMIAAQRPNPAVMAQLSDRRPETIGFTVKLIPNPDAAAGGNPALTQAQVFMRLGLSATVRTPGQPDKVQALALPIFPTAAPGAAAARAPIRSAGKPIVLNP
jgi:type VI secretion system protein ImpL